MSKWFTAFVGLILILPSSRLLGIEVCFVNDTDRTAVVTVITGAERMEQKLKPHSHVFVSLADSKNDRVVIAQTTSDETGSDQQASSMKVVDAKIVTHHTNRLNFCYLHGSEAEGVRLDLMAYVCLDIVPHRWGAEPSNDHFPSVRSKLIKSLASTTELAPESNADLKKFVRQFSSSK